MSDLSAPQPIDSSHDVSKFGCGKATLDEFLKLHALSKQRAMLSRTYVVTSGSSVVAYFTLAHISIKQEEAPKKFGRGMPTSIPAILLARLAIDTEFRGRGLGRSLFTDAVRRTWAVMNEGPAPVRFLVVDAKDEDAKAFYERFDMVPSPGNPLRLFLHYKSLRTIFTED
jgi:GNAT superfamily N-acetyltransferase